jgi:hypothetical protein
MTSFPPSPKVGSRFTASATLPPLADAGGDVTSQGLALWKIVSSYSSATVPDFHRIPRAGCADYFFAKNWLFFSDGKLEKSRMEGMCR